MLLALRQIVSLLQVSLASDIARPRHLLLTMSGFFIACLSLVCLFAVPAGLERVAGNTGMDSVAMVLSTTAAGEASSRLSAQTVHILSTLPGVARDGNGHAQVAAQFIASAKLRRPDGTMRRIQVRGVDEATWAMLGRAAFDVEGKRPATGLSQLVVGAALYRGYVGLQPGSPLRVRNRSWQITGKLRMPGSLWNSELWADLAALKAAFNVDGGASILWVKLASPDTFDVFADAVASDARLDKVRVVRQRAYYQRSMGFLVRFSRIAASGIAVTLGLGALLAITNALGMALASRRRETAVLRAMGFGRTGITIATLLEIALLGIVAAAAAILVAWFLLDGLAVTSATTSQTLVFTFDVAGPVMLLALGYSVALGLLSGLWPTFRMAHAPLVNALRSV